MGRMRTLLTAAAALLAVTSYSSAAIIDSFEDGAITYTTAAVNPNSMNQAVASVLGGERFTQITRTNAPPDGGISLFIDNLNNNVADLASDPGAEGTWLFEYDGGGSLDTNLLADGSTMFSLAFLTADFGGTLTVMVQDTAASGGDSDMINIAIPAGPSVQNIDFSLFNAAIDFTHIAKVSFLIDGAINGDYTIDFIETTNIPVPAAFPAGMALLAALAAVRRRRAA